MNFPKFWDKKSMAFLIEGKTSHSPMKHEKPFTTGQNVMSSTQEHQIKKQYRIFKASVRFLRFTHEYD